MKWKFKPFYGYMKENNPIVLEVEPEGFDSLEDSYFLICPNLAVAELTYKATMKIKQWRSADKA